jgi:hypothetical protein
MIRPSKEVLRVCSEIKAQPDTVAEKVWAAEQIVASASSSSRRSLGCQSKVRSSDPSGIRKRGALPDAVTDG